MSKAGGPLSDEILVVAAILGDLDAFNELVLRYRAAVVRLAESIVGAGDAEDVAQDALLLAFRALPSIEEPERFAAWLMAITRNHALRFDRTKRRREHRRVDLDAVLLEHVAALATPPDRTGETNEVVMCALCHLPEAYALPLRLHFLDGMPLRRIAAFLDVPLSTVKWRLYRGKRLMRDVIHQLEPPA
ncbi:RNA polymerase sigma factor [Rhodocaloribacter litoris]|uniref:RNA polymerase sigma factor n=1 Tax=Rhodocaloribacter litoris TaxID=2558931 RepID=UPI00141F57DA|nr:RNA polymerase sigma factor [Rhodocaloribacter litoris]QXD15925.1 RNA polymerase sigma factor [Rhodocaloribacter litoris]